MWISSRLTCLNFCKFMKNNRENSMSYTKQRCYWGPGRGGPLTSDLDHFFGDLALFIGKIIDLAPIPPTHIGGVFISVYQKFWPISPYQQFFGNIEIIKTTQSHDQQISSWVLCIYSTDILFLLLVYQNAELGRN